MIIIFIVLVFLFDLVSKIIISNNIKLHESINIIDDFFSITYTHNYGGAWSIFNNNTLLITIISMIVIGTLIIYLFKNKIKNKIELIGYSLVIGGGIGNLFDRIIYGYVIDFLDFNILGYEYPIFNLADTFIVIGIFFLIIRKDRSDKYDDNKRNR